MITQLLALLYFLVAFYGMGALLKIAFARRNETLLVEIAVRFCLGFVAFTFLSLLFGIAHAPLHWIVFGVIGLVGIALADIFPRTQRIKSNGWLDQGLIVALILALILSGVMLKGANMYPYLEDDDPWGHAVGASYIASEMNFYQDPQHTFAHYLMPYPPFYGTMMGVLLQVSQDVMWTLKTFNALLVGFMLLPAYLFFWKLSKSKLAGAIITAVLMMIPAFATHFIWAQTLALFLLFVALYALLEAMEDKEWFWIAVLAVTASLIVQSSAALMNGLLYSFLWFAIIVTALLERRKVWNERVKRMFYVCITSLVLALLFWIILWAVYGDTFLNVAVSVTRAPDGRLIPGDTSGGVTYGWNDFWTAPLANKIDQATGFGPVLMLLTILGIVFLILRFRKAHEWHIVMASWLLLGVVYINGNMLPIHLVAAHRYWPWLSIAVAMAAAFAIVVLCNSFKQNAVKITIILVAAVLIMQSAGYPKYIIQTEQWPPGVQWTYIQDQYGNPVPIDLMGYVQMQSTIPHNTKVYSFCTDDSRVIGFDMRADAWDPGQMQFRQHQWNATPQEIMSFLMIHDYKYITIDASCARLNGQNATQDLVSKLVSTQRFEPVIQQQGFLLAKIR